MEENKDSLFLLLFALTTIVIIISVSILGTVLFLEQKNPTNSIPQEKNMFVSQNQQISPQPLTKENMMQNQTQQPTLSQTQVETWIFKGYALGKNSKNENAFGVLMAEVIRLDDGRYRMYYGWAGQGKTAIKSAISPDSKAWTVEDGFRLQGANDKTDRESVISGPSIIKLPDGKYRMYYQSSPQPTPGKPPEFHVRSAISSDGVGFTREGVRIEIEPYSQETGLKLAGHGTYFITKDGTYVGIFSGNLANADGPSDLVIATSKDGLKWGGFKRLYQSWHDPIVLKTNEGYKLYATYLLEKQGMATSPDGKNWPTEMTTIYFQDEKGNRLTEGNSGVGDLGGTVTTDGSIKIFANWGNPSTDIVYFERQ